MNNLEYEEKKKRRLIEIIALIIALNIFLVLVFATTVGDGSQNSGNNSTVATTSTIGTSSGTTNNTTTNTVVGNPKIASVVTGANFTVALDSQGNVWSWGQNNKGQLGNGTLTDSSAKGAVLLDPETHSGKTDVQLSNVIQIAAGEYHAAALTESGQVYMWGYNYFGQVGSVEKRTELYPQLVDTNGILIEEIACGADYTLMVTQSGNVLGIGDSSDGQLGYYNDLAFTSIRDIEDEKATTELPTIKNIVAGYNHIVALDNNGEVWTWGDTAGSGFEFASINQVTFDGETIQEIKAGNGVSIALSTAGNVYTWDMGATTATKVDLTTAYGWDYSSGTPTQVTLDTGVQVRTDSTKENIAVLNKTYYIIDTNNKVFAWGQNNNGQTGIGSTSTVSVPTELKVDASAQINKEIDKVTSSAVAGVDSTGATGNYDTAYAINADGYVLGWGYAGTDIVDASYTDGSNSYKLLGDGTRYVANYIGSISVKSIVGNDITLDITDAGVAAGNNSKDVLTMLADEGYVTGGRVNLYKVINEDIKDSLGIRCTNEDIASYDPETGIITGVVQGRTTLVVESQKNTIYINVEVVGDDVAFAKIESRENYTVALKADGTVWAWGYNSYLGVRDTKHSHTGIIVPTQVKGLNNIIDIAAGENYIVVLKADGTVWAWGYNGYGQLGDKTVSSTSITSIMDETPELVQVKREQIDTVTVQEKVEVTSLPTQQKDASTGDPVLDASGRELYRDSNGNDCYKSVDGTEYIDVAGKIIIKKDVDNKYYKWNSSANDFETVPVTKDVTNGYVLDNIKSISASERHAMAVDNNGQVWTWGYNGYGELGTGDTNTYTYAAKAKLDNLTYTDKSGNTVTETVKQVEAGRYTSYIVTNEGNVYAWGYNGNYQCGMRGNYYIPTKVTSLNRITKISASNYSNGSAYALSVNGRVYTFGYWYGLPYAQALENVVDIYASDNGYGAIVKFEDGTAGYWNSTSVNNNTITKLRTTDGTADITDVMLVTEGDSFYTVVKADGTVWGAGTNSYGQLGNRTRNTMSLPNLKEISKAYVSLNTNEITLKETETETISASYNYGFNLLHSDAEEVEMVYSSLDEEIATVNGDVITAVKSGTTYVIAEDTTNGTTLRVKVNVLANTEVAMPDISVGYQHTVAVKTDGTAWGWGYNNYGELGETIGKIGSPTILAIDEPIKDVAAGSYHTLLLTKDGKVLAMGYNSYGQLGNNSTTTSKVPVTVQIQEVDAQGNVTYKDLEGIVKVIAYYYGSLALDENGNVYAWGQGSNRYATKVDTYGLKVRDISERLLLTEDGRVLEFINGTTLTYKEGLENIVEVSSSSYSNSSSYGFYMALDAQGNVYTWVAGTNSNNLVSGTETTTPTKVVFDADIKIVDIEAGRKVAYAKDENGNVYTWGKNAYNGTLGLGDSVSSVTTPTKVEALSNIEVMATSKYSSNYNRTFVSTTKGTVYGFGYNGSYSLLGNSETTSYYYEPEQVGQSYLGFVDAGGNEITRLSIEKGNTKDVQTSFIDSFNLRNSSTSSVTSDFEWRVVNDELISVKDTNAGTNTITANNIIGEAVVIAEEIDSTGNKTGVFAKLYIDVVEKDTVVAPKIESVNNHTVALKADGTVWVWGNNSYNQLGIRGESTVAEPTQLRIAKQVSVAAPIVKVNADGTTAVDENGKTIYVDADGNEYLQSGNNYTDLSGALTLKMDIDGVLYAWDAVESKFVLEDILDAAGNPIVIVDIATSEYHTLLLTDSGDVYSCGYNYNGRLGRSTYNYYGYIPEKIDGLNNIVKIAVGNNYSLALDKYGRLWTFGYVHYHLSGDSTCYEPIKSTISTLTKVGKVSVEEFINNAIDITDQYVVTKDGEVISLQLYRNSLKAGAKVEGITGNVIKATRTSGSGTTNYNGHTAFLTEDGTVFTIGYGSKGQLGNDNENDSTEQAVQVLNERNTALTEIRDIYTGYNHTMAVAHDGSLYTWGDNTYGQLRSSTTVQVGTGIARAYKVAEDDRIANAMLVSGGNGFTVVVDEEGYAFAWGKGTGAQLGNKLAIDSTEAVRVGTEGIELDKTHATLQEKGEGIEISGKTNLLNLLKDQTVSVSSVSSTNSVVALANKVDANTIKINPVSDGTTSVVVTTIDANGKTYENIVQVVVLPEEADLADDIIVPTEKVVQPMTVSGDSHTLILKADGTVWAYGENTFGQTGAKDANGSFIQYLDKATKVEFPQGTPSIIGVAAGDDFSIALAVDGSVYGWGYNGQGQLGLGHKGTVKEPTKLGLSNIVKVVAGSNQVLALDANGYVYSWGKNTSGSLGIGSTSNSETPIRIYNIAGAIDIAAGKEHAMILTSDGTVYTTGRNTVGQLGEEYITNRVEFKAIEINAKIAYIEAGDKASLAIDVNGNVWTWGNNEDGQLGLGIDDTKVYVPTKVTSISNASSASVGENHIHVVTDNGRLYVAGSNNYGQLGIGKGTEKTNTFVLVSKLSNNVMNSDAGTTYSTAIAKDGTVFGFGDYNHGNTERVSLTDSFEPVMISENTAYLNEYEVAINAKDENDPTTVAGTYQINPNGRYKLNVLYKDNSTFTYESTNTEIATVDDKGLVTAVSVGTTTVKVTDETGKVNVLFVKVIPYGVAQVPAVEGGDKFAVVTDENGTAYLFGNKENIAKNNVPSITNDSVIYRTIKAGEDFVVGLNNDGTVWAWGNNSNGQLGLEGIDSTDKMTRLNRNIIKDIVQIDAGDKHVIALDSFGTAYVWGDNSNGQLGIAVTTDTQTVEIPTAIRPVTNRIISASAGGNYSAIVDATGTAYIIRNGNAYPISGVSGAIKVATGEDYTLILNNKGEVYRVTNEPIANVIWIATQISVNKVIVDISVDNDEFMCLASDKTLYTFGDNSNGQLGNGSSSTAIAEVAKDVFTMGAANNNTYYINTKGEVLAAGLNTSGELGNGTSGVIDSSNTYVKVGNSEFDLVPETVMVAPNWKVLVGEEALKEIANNTDKIENATIEKRGEFNVFGNKIVDLADYNFTIEDTNIAEITDIDVLEITAKNYGTTYLNIVNKVTKEENKLKILVVSEELLRIKDMYVNDTVKDFDAVPDEDLKFLIDVEGSEATGTLNIELKYDDTPQVLDKNGNILAITKITGTNIWQVTGLDLTKSLQELTLKLTSKAGTEYEFDLIIYKEVIVKVNSEMLPMEKVTNPETLKDEKVFTKYINPSDVEANIEVTINNIEKSIKLEAEDGTELKTTNPGEVLTAIVNVPNIENKFIVKILDAQGKVEKEYIVKILKSSIISVHVRDILENPMQILADRVEGTTYLEEFSAKINDVNDPTMLTIKFGNKNITSIKLNGAEAIASLSGNTLMLQQDLDDAEGAITEIPVQVTSNASYTEEYIIRIDKISSNVNIEKIELVNVNIDDVNPPIEARKVTTEAFAYEIVMHDPDIEISTINYIVTLEGDGAELSIDSINYNASGSTMYSFLESETENKYKAVTIYVRAENGDVQDYKLYVYKESENADIDTIKVTAGGRTELATKTPGTNDYIGKVLKNQSSYEIAVNCVDNYSEIDFDSITIDGVDKADVSTYLTQVSGADGKYTYTANPSILGKTITFVVKPEYDGAPTQTYTLTIREMDDNANFEEVSIDGAAIELLDASGNELTTLAPVTIKGVDNGIINISAESDTAVVQLYTANPATSQAVASGVGELSTAIPFNGQRTLTLYLVITSEDGTSSKTKTITVTKLSNNADILSITLDSIQAVKDPKDNSIYTIGVSDTMVNPVIQVTPEDAYATITIDGQDINGTNIDISSINSMQINVTSEDTTVTKDYTLNITRLSSDKDFKLEVFDSKNMTVESTDIDTSSTSEYELKVKGNLGNLTLVITPEDSLTTVVEIKDANGNVLSTNNTVIVPSTVTQDIIVTLKSEDGNVLDYTIKIVRQDNMLDAASVVGTSGETITLTKEDIEALYKEARINPNSTAATVNLTVNSNYKLATVETYITYKDALGNNLQDSSGNDVVEVNTYNVSSNTVNNLIKADLASNSAEQAEVQIALITNLGEREVLVVEIVKGSQDAKLDYVDVTGVTTKDTERAYYLNPIRYTNEIVITSTDTLFDLNVVCAENGTAKIYEIADGADWATVLLATQTEITSAPQVTLDSDEKVFVILVTSEYGGNTARYKLIARKTRTNANLSDLTVTIDNTIIKQLSEFGKFDSNNEITVCVPESAGQVDISNLVFEDSAATAKWTDIMMGSATDSDYTDYVAGDKKSTNYVGFGRNIYIKVMAENGNENTYCIIIKKVTDDTTLSNIDVYNVTESKDEEVLNEEVKIKDSVEDIKVTANAEGAISLKVLKVNGFVVDSPVIATQGFELGENVLDLNLVQDYTYTDASGNSVTITKDQVKTIIVETTVISNGYHLYPTYYAGKAESEYMSKYELTVTRLLTDASIVMQIVDSNGTTTNIDSKQFVNGKLTIKVPSTETQLTINNIKANNAYALVLHNGNSANNLYTVSQPYTRTFGTGDKATITEIIEVQTDADTNTVYELTVIKQSANSQVDGVMVNDIDSDRTANTNEFNNTILASTNKLDIKLTGLEENATAKINIASINGTDVSATAIDVVNGTANLYSQLIQALANSGIAKANMENIVVNIEVTPEDSSLGATVYTLNIDVEKSNLVSINGLNTDGVIDASEQLTAEDFNTTGVAGKFRTDEIVVPSNTDKIELTNILCAADDDAIITDANGNDLTDTRSLTVNVADAGITTATIKISSLGVDQEFSIIIRKASTDASINKVIADQDETDVTNSAGAYELDVRSTVDPVVEIVLNNANAQVISAVVDGTSYPVVNNKFTLSGLATTHDDTEDKVVDVRVIVQAEDGNEAEYTITLVRKHTEVGLGEVSYEYGDSPISKTITFANTSIINQQIPSSAEGITITSANAVCENAKVYVKYQGVEEELDATKLYSIADGAIETFEIIVEAEYGNRQSYKLIVKRLSSNAKLSGIQLNVASGNKVATYDVDNAIFTANIKVTEDPEVIIVPENSGAKIVGTPRVYKVVNGDLTGVGIQNVKDTTFNIDGLSMLYVNDTIEDSSDENRYIIVEIDVAAEDTSIVQTHKLKITRQHVDTSIPVIIYTGVETLTAADGTVFTNNVTDTVTLDANNVSGDILVTSSVEEINIAEIIPNCENAQVKIEIDGVETVQTQDGFIVDLTEATEGDGCIRTVSITVTAESGDTTTYTIKVMRMATNASLNEVYVKGNKATKEESTDDAYAAIFKANVLDTDVTAAIKAISANTFATVSITDTNYITKGNNNNIEEGTYNLADAVANNTKEIELLIVVTPQDIAIPAKTYKLIITRQYASAILEQIAIKPAVQATNNNAIVRADNDEHTLDFTKVKEYYANINWRPIYRYWYSTSVEIPTEWTSISFGDIVPTSEKMKATITQISGANPYRASQIGDEIGIDTSFEMTEGEYVYIKVVTTAESGATELPYIITLYKKATSTELDSIVVNGKTATLDETDGIYKVNTDVNNDTISIKLTGENNLDYAGTVMTTIEADGADISSLITKGKSKNSEKIITFTLGDILNSLGLDARVITVKVSAQPEDTTVTPKEYTIQITRIHTSADIKQITGNDVNVSVDTEITHYKDQGKTQIDNSIYTQYIDENISEVVTDIIAESKWAKIYLNGDYDTEYIGKVEDLVVTVEKNSVTEIEIRVTSEDGRTTKDYILWFIRKSDDASIKELWVDKTLVEPNANGDYEYTILDTKDFIDVKMIPNYEFANVSINGQPFTWKEALERINGMKTAELKDGKVKIELRVDIPAVQSVSGVEVENVKYLYITRVSTDNTIESITTDNYNDKVSTTPHSAEHNGVWGYNDTYTVLLEPTGETRDTIELVIEPTSPLATVELYDMDGNIINSGKGILSTDGIEVDEQDITTLKVKVTPDLGSLREYYIDIVPKASQAELMSITIGGINVPVEPGKYDYLVNNLGLTGKGIVKAVAEFNATNAQYGISKVNIYTLANPTGTGECDGEASLADVDFDNTTYVTITVTSPNEKNTNTYTLWLKDVSDDRTLKEVSYNGGIVVPMNPSTDPTYEGEYTIILEPEEETIDLSMIATDPKTNVEADGVMGGQTLNLSKDIKLMNNDMVMDIIVTAESGNYFKYKLTIIKRTIVTGTVITENSANEHENETVEIYDGDTVIATGTTEVDGTFEIDSIPAGSGYKLVVKKDGYLTYTITDIPVEYGVRRYVGIMDLIAGEVATNDEYIDLRDLVQVNKLARVNTLVDGTNNKYDFNEDGIIDNFDLDILVKNYDKTAVEHSTFKFVRAINVFGEVIDQTNTLVEGATVEIGVSTTTDANGEFKLQNIQIGTYTLVVKDSSGNVIGSEEISIIEGDTYEVNNNVITIDRNMSSVDLTVRVNGSRAVVSKRGEDSGSDITNPSDVTFTGEVTENGLELSATAKDTNLSTFKFYSVATDGTKTEFASEIVTGVTEATVDKLYNVTTTFNETYKFELEVVDLYGNTTVSSIEIKDTLVKDANDLVVFSDAVNSGNSYENEVVKLASDLDLTGIDFAPIGNGKAFKGTFDGCGHTIYNINITSTSNYVGLFGNVNAATIKNVGIKDSSFEGKQYVAALVGRALGNTTIENCYTNATVTATANHAAGIVGYIEKDSKIVNCYNAGNITGVANVGGIAGRTYGAVIIENCYNIGTITGTANEVGEIIGFVQEETQTKVVARVINSYSQTANAIGKINSGVEAADRTKLESAVQQISDSATLLTALGAEFKADTENLNNGYPVLKWQQAPVTTFVLLRATASEVTLPISGTYAITSEFGTRIDPITGEESDMHYGIDIASNYQDAILAIANGTVTYAGENGGYGYCVEIEHVINGETVYSFYAHLNRIDVQVGDTVTKGQQIGLEGGLPGDVGAGTSTGVHLHLEIRKISGSYSSAVDPRNYLEF